VVTFSNLGRHGEFGNQLFQIAAVVGYAHKHNIPYILPKWVSMMSGEHYAKYFENTFNDTLNHYMNFKGYNEPDFHYTEIPFYGKDVNIDLFGYFQSEKYFENCKNEIISLFQPQKNILQNIKELKFNNSVCLQLRFYDNNRTYFTHNLKLDPENDLFYRPEENIDFYKTSINYFGKNKTYYVTTDNFNKAKAMFGSYNNFYFLDKFHYIEQFFIQSLCEHNIVSNSSFGWWGAYLNSNKEKIVYIPKKWFKNSTNNCKDLYPQNWKVV
jgi:hypothetical protein